VICLRADRRDIAAGARALAPWLADVVPLGLVIGVSAARADVPTLAGELTERRPHLDWQHERH
jgi:predicted branched-subunit amino acid permease